MNLSPCQLRLFRFKQEWLPGRVMQLDWTHANELEISTAVMPFPHRFCHDVLPNSNWSWLTICFSESLPSLNEWSQAAGFPRLYCRFASSAAPKLQLSLSDSHGQAIP